MRKKYNKVIPVPKHSGVKTSQSKSCTAIVFAHLNKVSGKKFKPTSKSNQDLVNTLLRKGYTIDQMIKVIDFKVGQWLHIDVMRSSIRPQTLFSLSNFLRYWKETRPQIKL